MDGMSPGINLVNYRTEGLALTNYATLAAGRWLFMEGGRWHTEV